MKLWAKRLLLITPLMVVAGIEFLAHRLSTLQRDLADLKHNNSKLRRLLEDQPHTLQMLRDAV